MILGLARDARFIAIALCGAVVSFASCSSDKAAIATSEFTQDDCSSSSAQKATATQKTSNTTTQKNKEKKTTNTATKTSGNDDELGLHGDSENALALVDSSMTYEGKIKGIIEKHCISCHYATSRTDQPPLGSVAFLLKDFKMPDGSSAKLYERIVAVWGTTMPPGDPGNIPEADTLAIKEWQQANYPGLGLKNSSSGNNDPVDQEKEGGTKQSTSSSTSSDEETEPEVKKTPAKIDPCSASSAKSPQNSQSGNDTKSAGNSSKTSSSSKQSNTNQQGSSDDEE